MAQLSATVKIDIELFRPKKYKDGWYYAVVQGKDKFVGLAKKDPFTCENPDPIKESGELWFEFGDTPSEAFHSIVRAQQSVQRIGGWFAFLSFCVGVGSGWLMCLVHLANR